MLIVLYLPATFEIFSDFKMFSSFLLTFITPVHYVLYNGFRSICQSLCCFQFGFISVIVVFFFHFFAECCQLVF